MLCCHLSLLLMVVRCAAHLQQGFCLQKTFCASKRLLLFTFIISKGLLKFSICYGGIVTEFNTNKKMACLSVLPFS